jgi:hypothetical protein
MTSKGGLMEKLSPCRPGQKGKLNNVTTWTAGRVVAVDQGGITISGVFRGKTGKPGKFLTGVIDHYHPWRWTICVFVDPADDGEGPA